MPVSEIDHLALLVRQRYVPDSPTHDHSHLRRVAVLATHICAREGGDQLIAGCGAWLHDLHRDKGPAATEFFVSPESMDGRAENLLAEAGVPKQHWSAILDAIHYTDRFSFSDRPIYDAPIEARALRDADILDAIGAIGVARTFSFGGARQIPLWVDDVPFETGVYVQTRRPVSTLHHFYEKLLRLPAELETPTAIGLAEQRRSFMTAFVDQFMREWHDDFQVDAPAKVDDQVHADRHADDDHHTDPRSEG